MQRIRLRCSGWNKSVAAREICRAVCHCEMVRTVRQADAELFKGDEISHFCVWGHVSCRSSWQESS